VGGADGGGVGEQARAQGVLVIEGNRLLNPEALTAHGLTPITS